MHYLRVKPFGVRHCPRDKSQDIPGPEDSPKWVPNFCFTFQQLQMPFHSLIPPHCLHPLATRLSSFFLSNFCSVILIQLRPHPLQEAVDLNDARICSLIGYSLIGQDCGFALAEDMQE